MRPVFLYVHVTFIKLICRFAVLTNRKPLALKETSVWAVLHTSLHYRQWGNFAETAEILLMWPNLNRDGSLTQLCFKMNYYLSLSQLCLLEWQWTYSPFEFIQDIIRRLSALAELCVVLWKRVVLSAPHVVSHICVCTICWKFYNCFYSITCYSAIMYWPWASISQ